MWSDVAEPTLLVCFVDAGEELVTDGGETGQLSGVRAQEGAADAGVLMDAAGAVGAAAGAQEDLAMSEVAEEVFPLLVSVGARYSVEDRSSRRRARNARCPLMASSEWTADGTVGYQNSLNALPCRAVEGVKSLT
ncbi:hypothetical protein [Actinomadura gamaensis]|uniref:Uncharacterized protein n=1 Tax=Actinomadura gamaensis TaxID=1763541 RepID=A0ABV9TWA7_9ACTN